MRKVYKRHGRTGRGAICLTVILIGPEHETTHEGKGRRLLCSSVQQDWRRVSNKKTTTVIILTSKSVYRSIVNCQLDSLPPLLSFPSIYSVCYVLPLENE